MILDFFRKIYNNVIPYEHMMISDDELFVILKSFYRSTDCVLTSIIVKALERRGFNKKGIITEAIREGFLQQMTPYHMGLTQYGREVYSDIKKQKLI